MDVGTNLIFTGYDWHEYFSRDGHFLATVSTNGVMQIWDVGRKVLWRQLTNTTGEAVPIIFFADGNKLITWSERDNLLHEFNLATGLEIQSWPAPTQFDVATITPDERFCLAIGEGSGVLRNLADESQTKLDLDALEIDTGSYSPDGKLFAIASSLGYARVWDTATWQPVTLRGFLQGVHGMGFSKDGRRLATGSDENEAVKLWDTESWQEVLTLGGQGTGFGGVRFSPDGNTIAWGNTTTLYLWRAPSWAEINAAEAKEKAESKQP